MSLTAVPPQEQPCRPGYHDSVGATPDEPSVSWAESGRRYRCEARPRAQQSGPNVAGATAAGLRASAVRKHLSRAPASAAGQRRADRRAGSARQPFLHVDAPVAVLGATLDLGVAPGHGFEGRRCGSGDRSCMFRASAAAVSSAEDPYCHGRDRQDTDDHERSKPAAIVTGRQLEDPEYGHRRQHSYCCYGSDHVQRPPFGLRLRPGFRILRWARLHDRDLPPP